MKDWARLNADNIVLSVVTQNDRPTDCDSAIWIRGNNAATT